MHVCTHKMAYTLINDLFGIYTRSPYSINVNTLLSILYEYCVIIHSIVACITILSCAVYNNFMCIMSPIAAITKFSVSLYSL